MAADVQRRGHGTHMEGLSVVAGAAHLLQPDAAANNAKNNAHAAGLRASYPHYSGISGTASELTPIQLPYRAHTLENFGPKLVQGDYTFHTARRNLQVSSLMVGSGLMPPPSPTPTAGPRGTIPAMLLSHANTVNMAAWKAYGSPSARGMARPPPTPAPGHANSNPQMFSQMSSKLPRVHSLGGGFRLQRPRSAPSGPSDLDTPALEQQQLPTRPPHTPTPPPVPTPPPASPLSAPAPTSHPNSASPYRRNSSAHGAAAAAAAAAFAAAAGGNLGPLHVEIPDPINAGKTDSGKVMFEHTLPTDPYGKQLWEEQARKARANMNRHSAAMAAAASVNGGLGHGSGGSGINGSGISRPASGRRNSSVAAPLSPTGLAALAAGPAMRPRFSSTSMAEAHRQGSELRPPTVVGFAAPDPTEDATLPGPGDPRWAYTRLGRSQIERLQHSLKMADRPSPRPSSAPTPATAAPTQSPAPAAPPPFPAAGRGSRGGSGSGSGSRVSPERSLTRAEEDAAALPPTLARLEENVSGSMRRMEAAQPSASVPPSSPPLGATPAAGMPPLAPRRSQSTLGQSASGMSAGGGSGSGKGTPKRPSSGTRGVGVQGSLAVAAAMLAEATSSVPPVSVRGSSAGRSREVAPNPRVDLRAYLAEEQAAADDDDGTEMLPVGDVVADALNAVGGGVNLLYDLAEAGDAAAADGGVPPDQLAARLAEVVAAVAVVAAQQQIVGEEGAPVQESSLQLLAQELTPGSARRAHGNDGDDALLALHGASPFGRGTQRYGGDGGQGSGVVIVEEEDGEEGQFPTQSSGMGLGLGLGLGLGSRAGSRGRPTSARPTSARPVSAMPSRGRPNGGNSGGGSSNRLGVAGGGEGLGAGDSGMDIIHEQSEGLMGDD